MPGYRPVFFWIACLAGVCGLVLVLLFVKANQEERRGEHRQNSAKDQPFSWESWNTRESIDSSKERLARYEKLKQQYFPEDSPHGHYIWAEEAPALPLWSMFGSDICAVVTVTKGCEQSALESRNLRDETIDILNSAYRELNGNPGAEHLNPEQVLLLLQQRPSLMWELPAYGEKESFEVEVEEYLFDRTGRYQKNFSIEAENGSVWYSFGRIPAYKGLRMVVFLETADSGNGIGNLCWNFFISEEGYIVPMTEEYGSYQQYLSVEDEYVGMWDYGGYRLEDYLEVVRLGYHAWARERNCSWTIYEYLNQKLTPAAVQPINGSVITSAWKVIFKEKEGETERYQLVALVEDFWIDEVLQQVIGVGTLELEREKGGDEYTVKTDALEWQEMNLEKGRLKDSFSEEALEQMTKALEEAKKALEEAEKVLEGREKASAESETDSATAETASEYWVMKKRRGLAEAAKRKLESWRMGQKREERYEKLQEQSET